MSQADELVADVQAKQEAVNVALARKHDAVNLLHAASDALEQAQALLGNAQYRLHLLCGGEDWRQSIPLPPRSQE